jgi:hypothetical protein
VVLATIEASLPQLIGAYVQRLSFRQAGGTSEYFLCIVSDSEERAEEFASWLGTGNPCAPSRSVAQPIRT